IRGGLALGSGQLLRLRDLLVERAAQPHAGTELGDVLLEAALHLAPCAGSASLSFTGSPMRPGTSSITAWMSSAPLLSASYAKMGTPSLEACANFVHWRITCLSR